MYIESWGAGSYFSLLRREDLSWSKLFSAKSKPIFGQPFFAFIIAANVLGIEDIVQIYDRWVGGRFLKTFQNFGDLF